MLHNDLLVKVLSRVRYLTWWDMSDRFPNRIKECERMVKLACHASKLKSGEVRLKGLPPSHKTCMQCDMYQREDVFHVIMQCPKHETLRREISDPLNKCDNIFECIFKRKPT